MRCVCCNSIITSMRKKKPVTSFSGELNSVFTDNIPNFPFREYEDMCTACIADIKLYNNDLNNQYNITNNFNLTESDIENKEVIPETMGTPFLKTVADYDGYNSIEEYEDKSYKIHDNEYEGE